MDWLQDESGLLPRSGRPFFEITASPRIHSRAVVVDFEDDAFQDVSVSIGEVTAMVRWGRARAEPSAALHRPQEARDGFVGGLIYRFACIGYGDSEEAYGHFDAFSDACEKHQVKGLRN